jgi:GGDEF domain-containing protein
MSIGVASSGEDGVDVETLLAEADRRMYKEKQENKRKRQAPQKEIPWRGTWPTTAVQ